MRVTLITSGFAPYRVALWNALAGRCELTIVFLAAKETHRQWQVDLASLHANTVTLESPQIFVWGLDWALNLSYGDVRRELQRSRPDVVIVCGYESPGYWAAQAWARRRRKPLVLWSESTLLSSRTVGAHLLDAIKKYFIRRCDAFYVCGALAADYVNHYGAARDRIVVGSNVADRDLFSRCQRASASAIPRLLHVGRLVSLKGVSEMFQVLSRCLDLPWRLTVAGNGPLRDELEAFGNAHGFGDRIEFLDFVPSTELPEVYCAADILLFPSRKDVWGMVVNEALLSGVYVLGSNRAAAALELIKPGMNGELMDPFDGASIERAIRHGLANLPFDRTAIRDTVMHLTPDVEAAKIMQAASCAGDSQRRSRT